MSEAIRVYVLHENEEWYKPLQAALAAAGVPNEEWNLAQGQFSLDQVPPLGVFYSKMSASSYTRGHLHAKHFMAATLEWLSAHERRVINGKRALELEVSKVAQHLSLQTHGLRTPGTVVVHGKKAALEAGRRFGTAGFIMKPNQGGKGQGVQHFPSSEAFEEFLASVSMDELTVDGLLLIQAYIPPKSQRIIRMEFIEGKFYYAVQVNTGGGFELCPADACEIDPTRPDRTLPNFTLLEDFWIPEIEKCETFLEANQIEIAGMEFLESEAGDRYFYDVNTNTNYNTKAEQECSSNYEGLQQVARFLKKEWEAVQRMQTVV
ncbi:MAG: alpha-L-glutamate ligase [Saprospiraceae bacterium]|nr:alpha-L-glutamate ligase [Saprospiraceae bacterium]